MAQNSKLNRTYCMWQYQSVQEAPLYQPQTSPEPAVVNVTRLNLQTIAIDDGK